MTSKAKSENEGNICINFIEAAKRELGPGHDFSFLRSEDPDKDPPDCWAQYKGLNVAVELMELNYQPITENLAFCRNIVDLLNKRGSPPIGISPRLDYNSKTINKKIAVSKIIAFLSDNSDPLTNSVLINEKFSQAYPDISKQIYLQTPREGDKEANLRWSFCFSIDELVLFFIEKTKKKIERVKKIKGADRVVLLLHFKSTWNDGTFEVGADSELLFAVCRENLKKIDKENLLNRCYVFCEDRTFNFYGHEVQVIRLK